MLGMTPHGRLGPSVGPPNSMGIPSLLAGGVRSREFLYIAQQQLKHQYLTNIISILNENQRIIAAIGGKLTLIQLKPGHLLSAIKIYIDFCN